MDDSPLRRPISNLDLLPFNGVLKRYRDWIRVDALGDVVDFDRAQYDAIDKLHKRSCDVVTAHDQSSVKAATVPTAADVGP